VGALPKKFGVISSEFGAEDQSEKNFNS